MTDERELDVVELEVLEGLVPLVLDEVGSLAEREPDIEVIDHDATAVRVRARGTGAP